MGKIIEIVIDWKHYVVLLSHKIRSKDKEMKRNPRIRVKYEETKIDLKI